MKLQTTALEEIRALAKDYADARSVVTDRVTALNDEVREAHRRKAPGINSALAVAKAAQERLAGVIQAHPELFEKPRTFTLHGIKIGLQKGKGALAWADDDHVIKLIRKNFAQEMIEALIVTSYSISKDALATLPAAELKKLGVTIEGAGEFVVIKPADGATEKLVKAILEEGARVAEVTE